MSFEIDLSGRRALVTGAGQHNGRAIARALAGAGAEVCVNDLVAERAERVCREIEESGGAARPSVFDVTDPEAARAAIAAHAPDVLVNNAGDTGAGDAPGSAARFSTALFLESAPADWARTIDVNFYGVLYCTHAALPAMVERGWGRVITIVSDAGRVPSRRMVAYSAAKAALLTLTRNMANSLKWDRIRVNALNIGWTATPTEHDLQANYHGHGEDWLEKVEAVQPFGRLLKPDDVARGLAFLSSDDSLPMTGAVIDFDQHVVGGIDDNPLPEDLENG